MVFDAVCQQFSCMKYSASESVLEKLKSRGVPIQVAANVKVAKFAKMPEAGR